MSKPNLKHIKKAIIRVTKDDMVLKDTYKVTKVVYKMPPSKPRYPLITYDIVNPSPYAFDEDNDDGGSMRAFVVFTIHDTSDTTDRSDDIEHRLAVLFDKGNNIIGDENIICHSSLKQGILSQERDPEAKMWVTTVQYEIVWSDRPLEEQSVQARGTIIN